MSIPRCCRTCVWWDNTLPPVATKLDRPVTADPAVGVCQAEPPKITHAGPLDVSLFPLTYAGRVCGWWDPSDPDDDDPPGEEAEPGNVVPFREAA